MSKNVYIYVLLLFGIFMAVAEVIAGLKSEQVSFSLHLLWGCISLMLTALWANEDAKTGEFERPFEFGFLIYLLWPILLPWYLIATRKIEGALMFLGILAIFYGPWLGGLVAYVYFT